MKDTKLLLKEAREAIKNKNYETSLKLCKQILREESSNYMALVLMGVSLQETGQNAKALSAFQDAIKANPTNSLAWNGLINYYEKSDAKEKKHELVEAYISLLKTDITEKKIIECSQKLCNLCDQGNLTEIVLAIYALLKKESCAEETELATLLVDVLSKEKSLAKELLAIYEEALKIVLKNQKTICIKYYADYLNLLFKQDRRKEVFVNAKKMHDVFQSDSISLKWICKIFNECYVESDIIMENEQVIQNYCDELLKSEPHSATAKFTLSILLIQHKKLTEAKDLLDQVVKSFPELLHAWILLLKIEVKLYLFAEAVQAANKIDKLLQSDSKQKLKPVVDVAMVEVLSRSDEEADLQRALQLYEMLDENLKSSSISHVIRANINLQNFTQAQLLLEDLKKSCSDDIMYKLLTAQLYDKQKKYKEALELLENQNVELSEWWLQIGLIHWNAGQHSYSLMPFLKATKLDSSNYKCFLLLGHYYKITKDFDKARRCYEKSFKLNTKSSEAGIELSKIYRKMKNWDANLTLLEALTGGVINKKNSWAWLQLGLHHLEQQDYDKAVTNLRLVTRIDESNINCWESLADAYLAKGAYTSALKCYEKVLTVTEYALYPLLQMASIKQILGEFAEARASFGRILTFNNSYVPALKGTAETCLLQAKECFNDQRLGSSRDHAQCAAEHLITALQQRNDLGCLWKLLGDSCLLVTNLSEKYCFLNLPLSALDDNPQNEIKILKRLDLFALMEKCYSKSVGFVEDNFLIWHDLAVCYLSHSRNIVKKELFNQLINKAQIIAHYCTSVNPTHWQHWNLLGNVFMGLNPPNYSRAQHSFIKAVMAANNSAVSWCNLGTLYFMLEEYKLANEAYSQAQKADPNYLNSWIGQALLAEGLAHEDAMDLFRHSTQLGFHKQGALGYAHWVCKTLQESPVDAVLYSIHNMHAIPVACDVMTWYIEHNPLDGTAWNMLGILQERMGLKSVATEAFKKSLNLTNSSSRDLAAVNYGRLLARSSKYLHAINIFTKVEAATFNSATGLALALFKEKRYKESYDTYESTLHWLSDEPDFQAELLVALASMAYMFDGPEAAKTLLFQSIQLEKSSPWSFYSTLALGLIHNDFNLVQLVLNEVKIFMNQKDCLEHLALLSSYFYLLTKNDKKSIQEVSRMLHRHPDQAPVWLILSSLLIQLRKSRPPSKAAAKCAEMAMKLGQNNMDVTKVLSLVALSFYIIGDKQNALWMAQKAIHCYPNLAEAWTILIAVLLNSKKLTNTHVKKIVDFVGNLSNNEKLNNWMQKMLNLT